MRINGHKNLISTLLALCLVLCLDEIQNSTAAYIQWRRYRYIHGPFSTGNSGIVVKEEEEEEEEVMELILVWKLVHLSITRSVRCPRFASTTRESRLCTITIPRTSNSGLRTHLVHSLSKPRHFQGEKYSFIPVNHDFFCRYHVFKSIG